MRRSATPQRQSTSGRFHSLRHSEVLVDNALPPRLAAGLSAAGHDAVHVRDVGYESASDSAIFELSAQERRVIVSADTDFGTLLALRRATAPSVVLFRGMRDRRAGPLLDTLLANLKSVEADLDAGAVAVFEPSRIRIRRLPMWQIGNDLET